MQGKALEIAVGDIGHVTINDADTVLNRIDGMKDLNAIIAAMTGRLYHGAEAADSLRVAALRNRLRASKQANHAKQARIIALESENASARSQIEWLNHVADVMTKGNSGLLEDNQRLRGELKRLTTPTVTLTDNITPALQAMADDETMLAEMAAEDAARPNPVTDDIIKEAAAILGDPVPTAKVDGATWDVRRSGGSLIITPADGQSIPVTEGQVVTIDLTPYGPTVRRAVVDDAPGLDDVVMVPGRSAMSQSLTAEQLQCTIVDPPLSDADAAKMHDAMRDCRWTMEARVRLCNSIQKYHYLPPLDSVMAWSVAQCEEADKWLQNVRDPAPAHVAEWELPF